jgi:hypothetical protein
MPADILIHLWLGFLVAMFCVVLYWIRKLDRRQRVAKGEIRLSRTTNS